eukprot:7456419-Pyramimonas_sp.AAC.1
MMRHVEQQLSGRWYRPDEQNKCTHKITSVATTSAQGTGGCVAQCVATPGSEGPRRYTMRHCGVTQCVTAALHNASPRPAVRGRGVAQCVTAALHNASPRRHTMRHRGVTQCVTAALHNASPRRYTT